MSDDGNVKGAIWPKPKFRFEVDFGTELKGEAFQEVLGMDVENQIIEYRKMPGIVKYGNITMKRGVFLNDNTFWDWHAQITMNTLKRRTVLIKLLDE